jgi:DNA-binding NtrC family response regulator
MINNSLFLMNNASGQLMGLSILVVEDDGLVSRMLKKVLTHAGHRVRVERTVEGALEALGEEACDLVLTDWQLPGRSGLELIEDERMRRTGCPVVLITGFGNTDTAIQAMRAGALDYLTKPFTPQRLLDVVNEVAQGKLSKEAVLPVAFDNFQADRDSIIGNSPAMEEVYKSIGRIAGTEATVLITGETGTGKELVARAIQQYSRRADKVFEIVNCGAIPETLFESELFGHAKGAFTGAHQEQKGRLQLADGGTLFLDEIGELPAAVQVKLLRFLQERTVQPVGGGTTSKVDVRVVAATNRNLRELSSRGGFRRDLFYRLNVARIHLPALRERGDDWLLLLNYFNRKCSAEMRCHALRFSEEALSAMRLLQWPGNVRQLENIVRQLLISHSGNLVRAATIERFYNNEAAEALGSAGEERGTVDGALEQWWQAANAAGEGIVWQHFREQSERWLLHRTMRTTGGKQTDAAQLLGITMKTLREKLLQYGLHPSQMEYAPAAAHKA